MTPYVFVSLLFFMVAVSTANYKSKHLFNAVVNTLLIFIYLVMTIIYFSADYFTGRGITQAVLFTLKSGLQGAGFGEYLGLIAATTFFFMLVVVLAYFYLKFIRRQIHPKSKRIKGIIHHISLLFAFLTHPFNLDLYSLYTSMHVKQSTDFDRYYVKPNFSMLPTKYYNLVYIYAESLEKTYFEESLFPNLMTNLQKLKKTGTEFTDINQVVDTGWTIGGMTATQCGIPLFTTSYGNSMNGVENFLEGAVCLGDVLKAKGYHLVFMQGSSVDFSGIRELYTTHQFDEIYGYDELKRGLENKNYIHGWGLFDDTLLPMAYQKFQTLSKQNKPFALFMATIDTHHPYGMTSKACRQIPYKDGKNSILNAVHCSDKLISEFIQKIQTSPYAGKTLIVLTSDHLAMRNTASPMLKKGERKDLFLIFDPLQKQYIPVNRTGSMLDVGATVLGKLGIQTALGLGRNLLDQKSLFALFGNFDKKLLSWRDDLLKLWQFAVLGRHFTIDTAQKKIRIGLRSYQIPMIAKISKDKTIKPIFELNSPKPLSEYFLTFDPEQKFIWVDRCNKINYLFDFDLDGDMCVAQGTLSSLAPEAEVLGSKKITVNTMDFLDKKYSKTVYHQRIKKLEELFMCRKPLPSMDHIAILSSRLPRFLSMPSAVATPSQFYPLSQKVHILSRESNGKYVIQAFDIYGSKSSRDNFIKTLQKFIAARKFWAIVAQHKTLIHTYPEYNKKLIKLGFKLLPSLDHNASYIAYMDARGKIHEYADKESKCRVIQAFDHKTK